ncbi:glycosyl transferase family 2 [Bacillus sp. MUM 116]|uniref:glycosyltransferase family 2 protein n=1 Tax=Bacillus sp. MUM 116 TaxID=1678002 RepID=UPI0008F5C5E1|nr:glycosyltransferase [Bacillus sp. MUM 116]OIK13284.1 glycosyl transferase family 2 [Bacillus sp. MUM 116]
MDITKIMVSIALALYAVLALYINFNTVYYLILSLFGFGKAKRDYPLVEDETRFLVLVAAHNEEQVIGSTIQNLNRIRYRKELYDVYVVNDNSTDRTGEICEELGMEQVDTSLKLFPREGVGKPAGLQYALRYLGFEKLPEKYDCLLILDADNHVDPDILKELNSQYIAKEKPEAIQAYLDSKNSTSSLSLGYAISYYLSNRFFQLAKYRMGLTNSIGGTGFIVRLDFLMKHGGFRFNSLTEDVELEMEIVKTNGRVLWNHFVRIYDEKPDNLKMSLKQRIRWSQGHWFVAFTNYQALFKKMIKEKGKLKILDQLIYLFGMARAVQMVVAFVGILVALIYQAATKDFAAATKLGMRFSTVVLGSSIITLLLFTYQFLICMPYAVRKDSRHKFNYFSMIFSILYYGYTYIFAQFVGLLKWRHQHTWVKTTHTKTILHHKKVKENWQHTFQSYIDANDELELAEEENTEEVFQPSPIK